MIASIVVNTLIHSWINNGSTPISFLLSPSFSHFLSTDASFFLFVFPLPDVGIFFTISALITHSAFLLGQLSHSGTFSRLFLIRLHTLDYLFEVTLYVFMRCSAEF